MFKRHGMPKWRLFQLLEWVPPESTLKFAKAAILPFLGSTASSSARHTRLLFIGLVYIYYMIGGGGFATGTGTAGPITSSDGLPPA